jgi:hypothetical protein
MKTSRPLIITIFFAFLILHVSSQELCKVLKPEISGKYMGKCKNGLADGKGLAEGTDKYEGKFAKGLPNGTGKYTWATGEVYEGSWKNGKRDGQGKYTYKTNGVETVDFGLWKDDEFIKKIVPAGYTVFRSTSITRYLVKNLGQGNRVLFTLMQNGNNTQTSNLNLFSTSGNSFSIGSKIGYENIDFPCTLKLSYSCPNKLKTAFISVEFEIGIKEPGNWEITINN